MILCVYHIFKKQISSDTVCKVVFVNISWVHSFHQIRKAVDDSKKVTYHWSRGY